MKVWIDIDKDKQEEIYKRGTIMKVVNNDTLHVKYDDDYKASHDIKGNLVFQVNDYKNLKNGFDDMVDMESLSEAELLYNLRIRYASEQIFTYVGPTLIVLNPYKLIKELFSPQVLKEF